MEPFGRSSTPSRVTTVPRPRCTVLSAVRRSSTTIVRPSSESISARCSLSTFTSRAATPTTPRSLKRLSGYWCGIALCGSSVTAPGVVLAEVLDRGDRVLLRVNDDGADLIGEGGLDRVLEPVRDANHAAHEADDATQWVLVFGGFARGAQQLLGSRFSVGDASGERGDQLVAGAQPVALAGGVAQRLAGLCGGTLRLFEPALGDLAAPLRFDGRPFELRAAAHDLKGVAPVGLDGGEEVTPTLVRRRRAGARAARGARHLARDGVRGRLAPFRCACVAPRPQRDREARRARVRRPSAIRCARPSRAVSASATAASSRTFSDSASGASSGDGGELL